MKYKILYLVDKNYVKRKMSRTRFHSIESLSSMSDITISGNNWDNFDSHKTISENFGEEIYKYNAVICYKPLEYKKFSEIPITKILRYNEMYDIQNTIQEINNSLPNIVICHHYNDYIYYKKYYLEHYSNIQFFYIPHCCNKNIFKDYNLNKIYDITISGAFGKSILGNHYPIRQRISSLVFKYLKNKYNIYYHKHPGYTLEDAHTNKYCKQLAQIYNQSKICITCSGKPKSRFGKYVEIPS